MNALAQLNEKLSVYQSPKVNWLTKQYMFLKILGNVCAFSTFALWTAMNIWIAFLLTDWNSIKIFCFAVGVICIGPILSAIVHREFEKRRYPRQKKVIEQYTNSIVQRFSENEYHEIKINLLKILNSEPYTPADFLDQMLSLKEDHDGELQKEEEKKISSLLVKDVPTLTVLIEKMEANERVEVAQRNVGCEKLKENIFKL